MLVFRERLSSNMSVLDIVPNSQYRLSHRDKLRSARACTRLCCLFLAVTAPTGLFCLAVRAQTGPANPVVVQPGAPGMPSKRLPPSATAELPPRSQAEVAFMQGMIMHHAQAVEMTALILSHTENKDLRSLGARINSSQSDEIRFMRRWLAARGEPITRVPSVALRVAAAAIILFAGVCRLQAQEPTPSPTPSAQEERNPFAPEPAPVLPPGMTGSDANDPRAKLGPGLYDAGEASMGIKHLILVKKPDAFQLGSADADDPKVQKTLSQLGMNNTSKIPKPMQLVRAQLAFAHSDFSFQGNHLFQGNFYGVKIYDIFNPANTTLLTSLVCPGGEGGVSVYKKLLFMLVGMPDGGLGFGYQGFSPEPPPTPE